MSDQTFKAHPGLPPRWWCEHRWERAPRLYRAIREGDLEHLRRWRNSQQDVLRQQRPLTPEHQRRWYTDVVVESYASPLPSALLMVVELDGTTVSYGGLTNIEWTSRRGELSFLTATERATDPAVYDDDFADFLDWMLDTAFQELGFNRVFTETWSFRSEHVAALERAGFRAEGRMRQHVAKDGVLYDALIHGVLRADRTSG